MEMKGCGELFVVRNQFSHLFISVAHFSELLDNIFFLISDTYQCWLKQ